MPTKEQIQQAIAQVHDQPSFIRKLLVDTLKWEIPQSAESIEGISFGWTPEELGALDLDEHLVNGGIYQIQPMATNQPWGIFLLEFANETIFTTGRGMTGPLRKVLRGLVPKRRNQGNRAVWDRENLLFICTHNYQYFRFAYFKSPLKESRVEPLTTFGWESGLPPRTVCEFNLGRLYWPDDPSKSEEWIEKWSKAFDVEAVTKKFYDDYEQVFDKLESQIDGFSDTDEGKEERRLFVQTLMNRLMFLRFVERKGWLTFGNDNTIPQDYLRRLYSAGPTGKSSWYRSRLKKLFFEGLAVQGHQLSQIIGNVPYLNGGLFERHPLDNSVSDIKDEVFEPILGEEGLFYKYNFTVEESTPLDIDVAVDPEMLGKVFEKLTNARRQRGSYYTPRTIVSFMCRETLKGYLGEYYAPLIDEDNVERIGIPEARDLLGRLKKVKVVDPACGSGAYLLGMLQELFRLTKSLDTRAETESPQDAYNRKLSIIQNNLYGVDIDEFAVNIARLRLWLSLAVEFEGDIPEPLPNLDLKIECGDSLTSPDPSGAGQMDMIRQQQIRELERLKGIHMNPRLRARYPNLENEISQLKEQIAIYAHPHESVEGFDWRVEFAEVWDDRGGFDIVIANPPYGVDVSDFVRNKYFNQRSESEKGQSNDSYGIFIARGIQLLRSNGALSYIVSDTWRTIRSHHPLRKRLLDTTTVFHILDLPIWIFDATVNTGIITLKKSVVEEDHKIITGDLRGIPDGDWKTLSDNLIAVAGHGPDVQTLICARYTFRQKKIALFENIPFFIASPHLFGCMFATNASRLGQTYHKSEGRKVWHNDGVCKIISGIKTGNNSRYIVKRNESVRGSELSIVDMSKVLSNEELTSLTFEEKEHGISSREKFYVPMDKGESSETETGWLPNYWVETDYFVDWSDASVSSMEEEPHSDLANAEFRFRNGITYSRTGQYAPTFRISCGGILESKSCGLFPDGFSVEALLAILCSRTIRYLAKNYVMHSVETSVGTIGLLPIIQPDEFFIEKLQELAHSIILHQQENPSYPYHEVEQKEIDALVYQLYGLSDDDIREIELWYCRRYPRLAEAQGLLTEVKHKYATHLERCKRILEKPPSYWRSNPILQLIAQGESHNLEFKETLEYDIRQNLQNQGLIKESLKTISAFLNTDGGTLLIGVSDSGEVKGIARDFQFVRNNNVDGFEQKLHSLINDRFDPSPLGNVAIRFEELQEGTVCKIDVEPVKKESIIHFDDDVYIRDGNRTIKLEGRALTDWIRTRTSH